MNKELLKKTFREYKKASGVKYAITNPDGLGDCMSCVNYALCEKYGEDSKGIWVKHWNRGMNAALDIKYQDSVYIAHDITEEQAAILYEVFGKEYHIFPEAYDAGECFELYEKGVEIWEVSYTYEWDGRERKGTYHYNDRVKAMEWASTLVNERDCDNVAVRKVI